MTLLFIIIAAYIAGHIFNLLGGPVAAIAFFGFIAFLVFK